MFFKTNPFEVSRAVTFTGVPEGCDALLLAELVTQPRDDPSGAVLFVASEEAAMTRIADAVGFFAPDAEVLTLPAWDCLPYDRVPPRHDVMAARLATLSALTNRGEDDAPLLVITTASAALQRLPTPQIVAASHYAARPGDTIDTDHLVGFLTENGYLRTDTVREPGEFAIRGGIIDVFPPGTEDPLRLDLFGDELEGVRGFDALSQRTIGERDGLTLMPASEIILADGTVEKFRSRYREMFGAARRTDALYEAVSAGVRHPGMEHWLPLFYDSLATVFDYVDGPVIIGLQSAEAITARHELIADYYNARVELAPAGQKGAETDDETVYNPLPPEALYLGEAEWQGFLDVRVVGRLDAFHAPAALPNSLPIEGRRAHDFADARNRPDMDLFDAVAQRLDNDRAGGERVAIAAYSAGSRDRMVQLMHDHGMTDAVCVEAWSEVGGATSDQLPVFVLGLDSGFSAAGLTIYTEQDVLGDRLVRRARRTRRAENFIAEVASLSDGDFVVHVDHGIGQFGGLETLEIGGAPHDCLRLIYANDDKLFLPVENLELLSRFGSQEATAQLDRLGGAGWQARRAKVKGQIKEIAGELLRIAAERQLRDGAKLPPPPGLYEEFCARFPFNETEDQARAIDDTIAALASGRPMDRLVCGDVGFGKTEVALRAAFVAALNGQQVAVVVPTTLLARQHYQNFRERFAGLPVEVRQLSRLVAGQQARDVRAGIADGSVDIVIGTHTLLGKSIAFRDLALLIVDEEQHFGVAQKERLKKLRSDVHVLTLSATPIPRTLQLALTGVRELSLIATPPVDRLAVRTFVMPYDPVTVREAIMREHFRGGQTFYVCPRIEDIARLHERLRTLVPEIKVAVAHGQMPAQALEDVMTSFYDGEYEVLLCTNIIESGLDLPSANTIIVHRADMFGLSQLYQLRGRVGRAKVRAYAYLTLSPDRQLSDAARKRLDVMQTLDSLGAGFSLASHDLDIRGAGNLLGEEQSGHIREVGVELYQQMLEEAVAAARDSGAGEAEVDWTPVIALGTPILIPETYVADLGLRLSLYRRIAGLVDPGEIDGFAAEAIDRFGPLPSEVENLLQVVTLKKFCRDAGVEKLDAGPKGAVISFRDNSFANPAALIEFITIQAGTVKLRPDHKLVYQREWADETQRLRGVRRLMSQLAKLATQPAASAAQ
ncbi:MAG: transcription-repair coupling factor [Alphaproteobacteria bacterium]|nr:transcription-repair coupling factor [Alphaproteobacteria bacterium]